MIDNNSIVTSPFGIQKIGKDKCHQSYLKKKTPLLTCGID